MIYFVVSTESKYFEWKLSAIIETDHDFLFSVNISFTSNDHYIAWIWNFSMMNRNEWSTNETSTSNVAFESFLYEDFASKTSWNIEFNKYSMLDSFTEQKLWGQEMFNWTIHLIWRYFSIWLKSLQFAQNFIQIFCHLGFTQSKIIVDIFEKSNILGNQQPIFI